jgi:hypothetical protein
LQVSIRLLDPVIYDDMLSYMEQLAATAAEEEEEEAGQGAVSALAPPAVRLLKLFRDLKMSHNQGWGHN